ncbi:MAG: aconitate hydratase [Ruminococcaceae bacterium]|nr:aconitate hydratase [Oscillospiraceae bacterium]
MGFTVAQKILNSHLREGSLEGKNGEIGIQIDQTLTQDSTGTMAYLQFEAMGIPRVKTELSVAYIDHNMLQTGFENADDHAYIKSMAKKSGIIFSRPGNGICHQVHLERFAVPGKTLIGSDSHTPTAGGMGMLAFGAGGLDVASAMGGGTYYLQDLGFLGVKLTGALKNGVSAKDVILEILRLISVKGAVGKIVEYFGDGIKSLTVPERATITNMGTELGATTSIFPSDKRTREFLKAQGREESYVELSADADAEYDEVIEINLSELKPLVACPHMPDNVSPVSELEGMKIDQVCIGSCTNSSLSDLITVAKILKGKPVAENVSLTISPGSRQVLYMLAKDGYLSDILSSGARLLECGCGPCIGMGQSPASGAISLRTFNRNFEGRSGTKDARVYLVSPETAAVSAIAGVLTDPSNCDLDAKPKIPKKFDINDNMFDLPAEEIAAERVDIVRGPNIKPFPQGEAIPDSLRVAVSIKVEDNITTDHIMPSDSRLLPFRSNIPHLSEYCFTGCDPNFPKRAGIFVNSMVVAGENYGQGSSREHAALVPLHLGVKAVLAKSFARIHRDNLINVGILPLTFTNPSDYDDIDEGDIIEIENLRESISKGERFIEAKNVRSKGVYKMSLVVSERQKNYLLAGGLLNYTREIATE